MICDTSVNQKFLGLILKDQNELHIWDTSKSQKTKCLCRFGPAAFGLNTEDDIKITCFAFTTKSMMLVGFSSGQMGLVDCSLASVLVKATQICDTAVK
jgi:hypothetical protein